MLLLAAAYLYATWALPTMAIGDPLGPKAFPYLLGILLVMSSALLLLESLTRNRVSDEARGRVSRPRTVAGAAAASCLFFALLEPLGYLIAFTLYLFLVMLWLHRKRPITCLAVAVLFTLGSYALFVKGLGISLPKGLVYF